MLLQIYFIVIKSIIMIKIIYELSVYLPFVRMVQNTDETQQFNDAG